MFYRIIAVIGGVVFFGSTALAQSASPSSSLATAARPSFSVSTTAPLSWLKFRRLISLNPIKDSELTLAIANRLLTEAQEEQKTNPDKAASTLDKFAQETTSLQTLTATISSQTQDPKIIAFLDKFFIDKTTQLTLLDSIKPAAATELSKKLTTSRAKTLREIVEILEKPNLSAAERQQKLDQIMQKYTEKETKIDQKIAKKLGFKDELDNETDDVELEDELAKQEDSVLDEASGKLDKDELSDFANELGRKEGEQSLVVLQKLLSTVPDTAKSGIETAIDSVIATKIEAFRLDPTAVEQLLNEHSGSSKVRTLLLERIKEQSNDETLKQQIELLKEKPAERVKKTKEIQTEAKKKAQEKKSEQQKETKSPEAKTSEKAEVKTSSSPEIKTDSTSIEMKFDTSGKLEKSSFTVKKNSLVTIRVESDYTSPITVTLSSGLGAKTINKSEKATMTPFTITDTVTFTANGTSGTINVE